VGSFRTFDLPSITLVAFERVRVGFVLHIHSTTSGRKA